MGGGFTGNTGDLEKDVCEYCGGVGSVLPENAAKICDYCGEVTGELTATPFMADVPAKMCRGCWGMTRETYRKSIDEDIGEFNTGG